MRSKTADFYQDARGALAALRFQLDGIVDGSPNPRMNEAAQFLERIDQELSALAEATKNPHLEVCPICGADMQATHAPWCQRDDGTPVPGNQRDTLYALQRAKEAFANLARSAPGDDIFLLALADLMKHLADWIYPLRQPF